MLTPQGLEANTVAAAVGNQPARFGRLPSSADTLGGRLHTELQPGEEIEATFTAGSAVDWRLSFYGRTFDA
jgi:hypothetical protein